MKFRYARHTTNLKNIEDFYTSILDFEVLGKFENHDGNDGIFIGKQNQNWHLEFTTSKEFPTQKFDEDYLLVFYAENEAEFQKIEENITKNNIEKRFPKNPYWQENGIQIADPDGYRIMITKNTFSK